MVYYFTMSEDALNAEELAMSRRSPEHQRRAQACIANRKLKLPPILPSGQYVQNRSSLQQQQEEFTDITNSINLPRLELCSFGLRSNMLHDSHNRNRRQSQKTDLPNLSIPRVYDVLPPIGKTKLIPSAPRLQDASTKPKGDTTNKRRRSRQYKTKKPTTNQGDTAVPEQKSTINIEIHAERALNHADETPQDNTTFAIHISDPCTINDKTEASTIIQNEDEEEQSPYVGFYNFSSVPRAFRPYSDLYPPSPPPTDRKARNIVEKKRQELKDENKYRLHFMKSQAGYSRRNATCPELDDSLKNATELLREMFLRKTMEELCMLW